MRINLSNLFKPFLRALNCSFIVSISFPLLIKHSFNKMNLAFLSKKLHSVHSSKLKSVIN